MQHKEYLFKSERLGFRNWVQADVSLMDRISGDPEVMRYFPATKTTQETQDFILRMQQEFEDSGFCYFAVDRLDTLELIGFIGISAQTYEAPFNPSVDIGWRLGQKHWRKGFATEGAARCLQYAFEDLGLEQIVSVAPQANINSIRVMQKIGMKELMHFRHPLLEGFPDLVDCICYEIRK